MPTILLLDRDSSRRERLVELVRRFDPRTNIEVFVKPEPALSWLYWHNADLAIANSRFTDISVTNLIQRVRALPGGNELPLLMMAPWNDQERRRQVLDAGATDLLATPLDDLEFHARYRNLLTQHNQQKIIHERARWLEQRVSEATSEIRQREHETLLRLAKAGEYRDEDTGNHVIRMAKYARIIAEQMGLSVTDCETIELAAPMHDIGKIGIPDDILRKPGRLTHCEFEIMKTHTRIGYEILKDSPSKYLQMGAVIALSHHEKFNGTGYPNRLGKQDIPLAARIVSVADAYDALTSERPYKPKWSMEKTLEYLNAQRGKFFDPDCLDAFNSQLDQVCKIQFMLGDKARNEAVGN
ncbi:MAG: two-component system response regulator [Gammaproteobacteria bacterium]|nr:MAG: two-component system response regulator [Gammaproteobacteria bacterium]